MGVAHWSKQTVVFVLTVVLVVFGFMIATAVVLLRSTGIGASAHQITDNAVPSLEALIQVGSDVQLIRVRMEAYLEAPGRERRREIWRSILRLRRDLTRYVALPAYPEERRLWGQLLASVDDVVADARDVFARADAGDLAGARRLAQSQLEQSLTRVEASVARGQQINAQAVRRFTRQMEVTRAAARRDALVLNGLCVLLAAGLVTWALRSMRRQRALEARYAQVLRERADELEMFAGRVAHDILSPLSSSALALEVLVRSEDDKVRRTAQRGLGGIGKVRSTVDGLLEFARAGARPSEGVVSDLVEVAADVVGGFEEQARAAGIQLELAAPEGARDVAASRGVLTSVLTNLIQNAIRYMGDAPVRRVSVRVRDERGRVRVEVQDTGPGIAPQVQERIFEPYFRARERETPIGIGLGLATVRRLVEAHGGCVTLETAPGRGSTFAFELPLDRGPPPRGAGSCQPNRG